jgi:hypothetical protein
LPQPRYRPKPCSAAPTPQSSSDTPIRVFFFVAFVTNYEEEKTKSPDYIEIGEEKNNTREIRVDRGAERERVAIFFFFSFLEFSVVSN